MPLSHPLTADLGEMGGVITAGACIAAGLVLTAPTAAARRRARRARTAAFRLRRRRNFWRYLLGWGELPPPTIRFGSMPPAGWVEDVFLAGLPPRYVTAVPFRSAPLLDVDRITQEG